MSSVYVFLGPTLAPAEAAMHSEANVLPPARQGDIHDAVTRLEARAIGLVDGLWGATPAVWHKEILFALSRGVRVFGAASMGALRAAELRSFGMEGVGAIFAAYAAGELTDDDEVAVAHGPAESNFRPLSEALVNIRHGLELAERAGTIGHVTRGRLLAHAKATFYAERSWPALFRAAPGLGVGEDELASLRAHVARVRPNRKRDDAILLLQALQDAGGEDIRPHAPGFAFEATTFWEGLVAGAGRREAAGPRDEALARHALLAPGGDDVRRGALLLALVLAEAERHGIEVGPPELRAAAERFRRARGLHGREETIAWLQGQGVGPAEYDALLHAEALVDAVARLHAGGLRGLAPLELQRRGSFAHVRADMSARSGVESWSDAGLSREALLEWYEREIQWIGPDLPGFLRGLGFATLDELLTAIARLR
jgi:hypothetical protein